MTAASTSGREAHRAAELAARASYGRLLAVLSARTRDVAAAEDALADALKTALENWADHGVPDNPEAWLMQVARRRVVDSERRTRTATVHASEVARQIEALHDDAADFPDERLRLLFACAHPQIDPSIHTPLMLQAVLGLDAARIASAFLVSPAAMGQRLSRAKAKIREQRLHFQLPDASDLPERLEAVLQAIYAAYNCAWDDLGEEGNGLGLCEEALFLARLVATLSPGEPEPMGLLALILFCESRVKARRGRDGSYIPLDVQDTSLWSRQHIEEAEWILHRAALLRRPGRFQLEAAIQSAHAERARGRSVEWPNVMLLYDALICIAPSLGAWLGRAAALAACSSPEEAYDEMCHFTAAGIEQHQPYWALRAHLAATTQRFEEAKAHYGRAAGLATDPSVRAFLLGRIAALP